MVSASILVGRPRHIRQRGRGQPSSHRLARKRKILRVLQATPLVWLQQNEEVGRRSQTACGNAREMEEAQQIYPEDVLHRSRLGPRLIFYSE